MKTIQVYLQLHKDSIKRLIQNHGLGKIFILLNDDQFSHMVMVGEEGKMDHDTCIDWDLQYIKCEVHMDDILAGAVASQLGNVHTTWRVKILDHPYPLNHIKNLEKLESYG